MVCDGAMVASTIASIMMNGVCCFWQMQEEEDRRETLRKDIRVEYERQRLLDLERWAHHRKEMSNRGGYHSDSSVSPGDHRRRDLIRRKMNISSSKRESGVEDRDNTSCQSSVASACTADAVYGSSAYEMDMSQPELKTPPQETKRKFYSKRRLGQLKAATVSTSDMSSLLDHDDGSENEDEELSSFEDVALQ